MEAPPNSIHPKTRSEWRKWLAENQARTEGVWLISFKKATGKPCVEYDEAVEEALCFGWIDSKTKKLDEERSMLWFSPRKPGAGWARSNKERVEKLMESGRMAAAGLARVEAAKQDGTWYALDSVEALIIPLDLDQALSANQVAKQYFDALPRSVKRAILAWIASAKRPETRSRRVTATVESAAENSRPHPWQ
jgi:uncharacterized protein YdeI (YjbR/CyaY-like superfamily)